MLAPDWLLPLNLMERMQAPFLVTLGRHVPHELLDLRLHLLGVLAFKLVKWSTQLLLSGSIILL